MLHNRTHQDDGSPKDDIFMRLSGLQTPYVINPMSRPFLTRPGGQGEQRADGAVLLLGLISPPQVKITPGLIIK